MHTGRSPKDKFVVCDESTEKTIWWAKNGKLTPAQFDLLHQDFLAHAKGKQLYAQDLYAGADQKYRIRTRVYTELAWHSLFIHQLLIRPDAFRTRRFHSRIHDRRSSLLQSRPQTSRRSFRDDHCHRLYSQSYPDRQLVLRGRDQEVGLHRSQFLSAGTTRDADALLGKCRQERRCRAILWSFRNRQDYPFRRSQSNPDR